MERFWSKVEKTDTCWLWRATVIANGYGQFSYQGKRVGAHRMAYLLEHGSIPEGAFICHRCDVRNCVRPDHLFAADHAENMHDRQNKGRTISPGPRVPLRGELHQNAKLTAVQVADIRARYQRGVYGYTRLAQEFGVSSRLIYNIIKHEAWSS